MAAKSSAAHRPDSAEQADLQSLREDIRAATLRDEATLVREMLAQLKAVEPKLLAARERAAHWVNTARADKRSRPYVDSMLEQFPLDSEQGRALMSLAEALLRTPDKTRADQLISERLASVREAESADKQDLLTRAAFALLGTASRFLPAASKQLDGTFTAASITRPLVAPVVRASLRQSMQLLGQAFISGETIEAALKRGKTHEGLALCSFDVLGEGARTEADADRYFAAYGRAIEALRGQSGPLPARSAISVKLSAIEPRYSLLQEARVRERLIPRVIELARKAAAADIGFTIDAEEADRLDLSLDIIAAVASDESTKSWSGLGFAVQAYGRRAPLVVDWAAQLARATGRRMTVRLVKGAYWDSEIKRAQERGLASFPVFTSKAATDASYLICAQRLFAAQDVIYPQFATHNAFTVAAVLDLAPKGAQYEFQRLHGMGEVLYRLLREQISVFPPVRAYAPVGTHEDLLAYLVRRLLENGANTSFVHQFLNPAVPVEDVVRDPISILKTREVGDPDRIREPRALYGATRANSDGLDFGDPAELAKLHERMRPKFIDTALGGPIINGVIVKDLDVPVFSPTNNADVVGLSRDATATEITQAFDSAGKAQPGWNATPAHVRAACLEKAADLLTERREAFFALLVREAGKTLPDAVAEVRETIDFCRYYAARGREIFSQPEQLAGPTGERNLLSMHGRGVFACISPWNFPLAIFAGQITAALMAGNSVIAKPAPATPLIAHAMTRLLHEAGIPGEVLQLTPADGPAFAAVAFTHPALAGVAFTGSTMTATTINRALANREGPILPLIAETGGVNAMIVDATALAEQVVDDAVTSAFTSAGQRCSALRVLYLQEEIADRVIDMLVGAMKTLVVGDPAKLSTDVGPVISSQAASRLAAHIARMKQEAKLVYACPTDETHTRGHFIAPHLFELNTLDQLRTEEFGPILHFVRYRAEQLPQVVDAIRRTGFGLTLGVHSRLDSVADHVFRAVSVGNTYVNRNMIGAVVGVQPFGGCGLSGTGPKAGGPHYLTRFATERTLTINTAAAGGNVELLSA